MDAKTRYTFITLVALAGMLYSGYLTYVTYASSTVGCEIFYFGLPSCFYGMLMYAAIFIAGLAGRGLAKDKRRLAISAIAGFGTAFAIYVTSYVMINTSCKPLDIFGMPPCVPGLIMYAVLFVIAVASFAGRKRRHR